ncbi:MAG: DUF3136 domain-containing protein [Cyanobacteria bacterium]|nr:DUF3136 domain-containing protein [Cyanobacteriota bacterium]
MSQATFTTALTIGELEASYPLYCKALRILIREEKTIKQIQRSVCWHRLGTYQRCCPLKVASLSTFAQLTAFCFSWATS